MRNLLTICIVLALCGSVQAQMLFGVDMDNEEIVYLNSQSGTEVARFAVPGTSDPGDDDIGLAGSQANLLYYCNGDDDPGTIYVLNAIDGSINSTISITGGWNVNGLGYESGASALFTSGCGTLDLHKYADTGGAPTFFWGADSVDNAVGSDDNDRLFAAQLGTGDIVEINPLADETLNTLDVDLDGDIVGMAYDGTNLYASTTGGMLYTLDPDDGTVLNTLDLGFTLDALAAATGGPKIEVNLDIKPGSCPNPLNPKSKGVVPVAIVGTLGFEPADVDLSTVLLEGLAPVNAEPLDSTQPGDYDPEDCYDCFNEEDNYNADLWIGDPEDGVPGQDGDPDTYIGDGITDLVLYFDTQDLVDAIGSTPKGECVELTLTGELLDGTPIEGSDSVVVLKAIQ